MADILQTAFSNAYILIDDSAEICSQGSIWQQVSINSGNGLSPNRLQTITWTNVDQVSQKQMVYPQASVSKCIDAPTKYLTFCWWLS